MTSRALLPYCSLLVFGFAVLNASAAAADGEGTPVQQTDGPTANQICPVIPEEAAHAEYFTTYRGRRIHFCCANCVRRFEANPEAYVGNLPAPKQVTLTSAAKEPWTDYLLRQLHPIADAATYAAARPWFTGFLLAVVVLTLLAVRTQRRLARGTRRPRPSDRFSAPFGRPTIFLILVLGAATLQFALELWIRPEPQLTLVPVNKPDPPVDGPVSTFAWPQALHDIPKGLSNTYYRGNDERHERLFNGGRYRTATLFVSVRDEDGREKSAGDRVGGQTLFVNCRFVRAANTADGFFAKRRMAQFHLFRAGTSDGNAEPVPLTTLRDDWEWEVAGRIGLTTGRGYERFRGVWFLGALGDSEPHFAIQYCIHLQDGKIDPASVAWMFPVVLSPILDGPKGDAEWFSDRPIPEIPDGKSVDDPKLLGLTRPNPANSKSR